MQTHLLLLVKCSFYASRWWFGRGFALPLNSALALPLLSMLSLMRVEDLMNALARGGACSISYAFTIAAVLRFVPVCFEMNHYGSSDDSWCWTFKNPLKKLSSPCL